jgi:signal transduction histidine kinase/ligand-binding sensor domain-containing protein
VSLSRPGSLLGWLLCAASCFACALRADDFALRVWETDDGLAHNGVNSVLHANDGFLWLATQNGVMRFDGHVFRKWHSPLLSDTRTSSIRALIQHDGRTLLLAHDGNGLLRLANGVVSVHPLTARFPRGYRIVKLLREDDATFWIAFANREFWRCAGKNVEVFPAPAMVDRFLPLSLARDFSGGVYLARGVGVERYDGKSLTPLNGVDEIPATISSGRSSVWVATSESLSKLEKGGLTRVNVGSDWPVDIMPMHLLEDRSGALWIGTKAHGILRFKDGRLESIPASYPRINELIEDREGNIWAASAGGGLNRIQPARFTLLGEEVGVLPDIVGSVCEDAAGNLWFGNRNCFGQVQAGRLVLPASMETFARKAVPLCPDGNGNVWFAVASRLALFKPGESLPPGWIATTDVGTIHAIFTASDGSVWVAGEAGPLLRHHGNVLSEFGEKEGFTGRGAQAIAESPSGDMWFGTEAGEVFRYAKGQFMRYGQESGLPRSATRAIHVDAEGNVWIGTGGGGLFVWRHGQFHALTEQHGLPDDTISQIVEDGLGILWLGSSRALFKAPKSELLECALGRIPRIAPVVFGKADGLSGFSAAANYQPSTWKARDGRLWFATRKGLVTTRPDPGERAQKPPPVFVEAFGADGRMIDPAHGVTRSSARRLEFRYTAPTFTSPEKVQFRHRLDGLDTDWTEAEAQRVVTYSQLPPGRYALRVTASNRDLLWSSEEAVFAFEVSPQWWQTWWARACAALLGVVLVAGAARFWSHRRLRARVAELEARRRLEAERSRIARDLHDSLGASLTQAGMLADEICEDSLTPSEMREHTAELGNRVRLIARDLDAAVWAVSPKNDTLASLSAYLSQFALEFFRDTPTRCRVEIADDIPRVPLSPEARHHLFLTAREAMNNILKHARAGEVHLSASARDGIFELRIADDGEGFSVGAEAEGRHGLRNMQARVDEIGGTFEINSSHEGTVIHVTLPIHSSATKSSMETLAR